MTTTKEYAAMLYSIADEIEAEGRITPATIDMHNWTPETIREAAERLDVQTVKINQLRKERDEWIACHARIYRQRDELLAALEYHQEQTRPIQRTIDAIASVKGGA